MRNARRLAVAALVSATVLLSGAVGMNGDSIWDLKGSHDGDTSASAAALAAKLATPKPPVHTAADSIWD